MVLLVCVVAGNLGNGSSMVCYRQEAQLMAGPSAHQGMCLTPMGLKDPVVTSISNIPKTHDIV